MDSAAGTPDGVAPEEAAQPLTLEFRGTARGYFRVWIVNLCLTLLTAGIFSAWAKVRKKRYLYSHTTLDGTPFQYLAQPVPILKGRLIAAALFSLYYAASHFFTELMPYVLAVGLVLAPWVVVRSAAFNARYSAYRNMTFRFSASYKEALVTIYWLGIVPAFAIGTIFRWWGKYQIAGAVVLVFMFTFPWWLNRLNRFIACHTSFGGNDAELGTRGGQFFKIYFLAGLIAAVFAAIGAAAGGALLAAFNHVHLTTGAFGARQYSMLIFVVPFYAGYVVAFAFIKSRVGNLIWNNLNLGPLRFCSTLRARDLFGLYVSNALAIVASAGLLIPWAAVRMLRYRVDRMQVVLAGELDQFRGGEGRNAVKATGAEIGDFFDMDLSL